MTSCLGYCTSVTKKEYPGFRSCPILFLLVLKLRFSVCFKSYSLISKTETSFTLSTRNIKELGYCFWIWIKSASHRLNSAIYNKRSKSSYKAKGSMQSVNTITSYWQTVTEAQKWPGINTLGTTHYSNTAGSELATGWRGWVCISLTQRKYGCILWLKVVTPKPATYREYEIMIMLNTSRSQTDKRFVNNRSAVVFPLLLCSWHIAFWQRGRIEQSYCKRGTRQSYSIVLNINNKIRKHGGWLWIDSIKGNRQGLES